MAKRFIDTDLFKKSFFRGLEAPYKVLWIYILTDCNFAGIWEVDLEVAGLRCGFDYCIKGVMKSPLAEKIVPVDNGEKWFIPSFVDFQYGTLNESNRAHAAVCRILERYQIKPLVSSLQGAMDKDMDKDLDLDKDKDKDKDRKKDVDTSGTEDMFEMFWHAYPQRNGKRVGKQTARKLFKAMKMQDMIQIVQAAKNYAVSERVANGYAKDPERFLKNEFWKDWLEPEEPVQKLSRDAELNKKNLEAAKELMKDKGHVGI